MSNRNQRDRDQHENQGHSRHHYELGSHRYSDQEYQQENRNARMPRHQNPHFESDDERRQRAMYSRHRDEDQRHLAMRRREDELHHGQGGGWHSTPYGQATPGQNRDQREHGNRGRNQYDDDDDNRYGRSRREEEESRRRQQYSQQGNEPHDSFNRDTGSGNGRYGQSNQNQGGYSGRSREQGPSGQQDRGGNRWHEQDQRRNPNQRGGNW